MHAEPGISRALADDRASRVSNLHCAVHLTIPAERLHPIRGTVDLSFSLSDAATPLLVDFAPIAPGELHALSVNGSPAAPERLNGHVVIQPESLTRGANVIHVSFTAGDAPLNRRDDHVYTIFVPARAHEALPCFDQPNLKARWTLTLDVPLEWRAVSNTAVVRRERRVDAAGSPRQVVEFAETRPLPTYLFAFAAGAFSVEQATRGDRDISLYHCGVDPELVAANLDPIVDGHASALDWMERYTAIAYPFDTFDLVLLPAFQFGGMEHPGAIFYNASSVLLQESATRQQRLARAHVIAHETAHMWFGDLVTMTWFDDVWMKEVFANFVAARIVHPQFPDLDHALRFLQAHYPGAYEVDRTAGTHAIRQRLDNLAEAGSLYGAIIYLKSPIVMRQLELLLGEEGLRDVLREYLSRHAYGNASWPDLVELLASSPSPVDLRAWSHGWIDEAGRPAVHADMHVAGDRVARYSLTRRGADGAAHHHGGQRLDIAVGTGGRVDHVSVWHDGDMDVPALAGWPVPDFVLPNGRGLGYGEFHLDGRSLDWLLAHLPDVPDALTRGSAWLTLWDAMLIGQIEADALLALAMRALQREDSELNLQRLLTAVERLFWIFTGARADAAVSTSVERALLTTLDTWQAPSAKAAIVACLRAVATTPTTLEWMRRLWHGDVLLGGLPLGEADHISIAEELAVRGDDEDSLIARQLARTTGRDRREALAFIAPALSPNPAERDRFFDLLRDPGNRRREPWAIEGLRWLHHPLREAHALAYLEPGLLMLEDVKRNGDIFLPKRWLDAMLGGHRSLEAVRIVRAFVGSRRADYPVALTRMTLASADPLFRAASIVR